MAPSGRIRIGISGWRYKPWRGVFFPEKLPQRQELRYAAGEFDSIEINGTFYGLQNPASFARWADDTPEDFMFAVKGPRYISHIRRLRDVRVPLANFLASGPLTLGSRLGPILWQFPPSLQFDPALFEPFLAMLPQDGEAAARLAREHDARHAYPAAAVPEGAVLRHAFEIRHESFCDPRFVELLRAYKAALVCADTVAWPRLFDTAADFVYCRLHGSEQLYASGYGAPDIALWAGRIERWARGGEVEADDTPDARKQGRRIHPQPGPKRTARDVFVYFDNDMKVRAPFDAKALRARLDAMA